MSLWSKIAGVFTSSDGAAATVDPCDPIGQVVMASGLTKGRPEDVDFYVQAYEAKRLTPSYVRTFGTLLTSEEKEALGVSGHLIVAREFIATLNDQGLADPEGAALKIARSAAHRCYVATRLLKMKQAGIELARFRASPTAAGPCAHAAGQDGARMPVDKASPLPFDDCSHPEQCGCLYQAWQNIADDMDDFMV